MSSVRNAGAQSGCAGRQRSLRELQLPQKRLVARIAGESAHQPVGLDLRDAGVALGVGALEPLERQVGLAAEGMRFGNLVGPIFGYLSFRAASAASDSLRRPSK